MNQIKSTRSGAVGNFKTAAIWDSISWKWRMRQAEGTACVLQPPRVAGGASPGRLSDGTD